MYGNMYGITKKSMILFLVFAMFLVPLGPSVMASQDDEADITGMPGLTEEDDSGKMFVDFILKRPIGLLATIAGSTVFIVSLPFSAVGGNAEAAYEHMVLKPARYTFIRPLGAD